MIHSHAPAHVNPAVYGTPRVAALRRILLRLEAAHDSIEAAFEGGIGYDSDDVQDFRVGRMIDLERDIDGARFALRVAHAATGEAVMPA